ncbi:AbrB/MazE/SpoVT family DNA-binding domain-containing protein [Micropruina sp.]|uniref:AbrB/MazE/SpoVT family DNA-binding domain-containing protein n=1 Tax=Micropruina sp. TaxID=2737536 RepID=UPI0039E5D082
MSPQVAITSWWVEVVATRPDAGAEGKSITRSTVSSRGQVTIPKSIRDELGLGPGAHVSFVKNSEGGYELHPESRPVTALRGSLCYSGPPLSIGDMEGAITDAITDAMQ